MEDAMVSDNGMWIADLASGRWLRGGCGEYPFNPATEIGVRVPADAQPDPVLTRYDPAGQTHIRAATQAEIDEVLSIRRDAQADGTAPIVAVIEFYLRRTLGRVPRAEERLTALGEYRAILRGLLNGG